jgi:hypothetical protein
MDLFSLVSALIMGGATLCGLSLLVWLIVMERKGDRCDSEHPPARPGGRQKERNASPRQARLRRPLTQRQAARVPGPFQTRSRPRGSGRA